jgi:GNAT superfamily N-acetyltransferase
MILKTDLTIRAAQIQDVPAILSLIHQKAAFDASMDSDCTPLQATEAKLHQTLFNDTPFAKVLLVERSRHAIGFALYYFRYSSFAAQPSLWLDDLYLEPEARGQGMGRSLMVELAREAQKHHCTHIAWTASKQNDRGISFYQALGAEIVGEQDKVFCFRANSQVIQSLLKPNDFGF